MVTLQWTPQAVEDLYAIFEYISHDSRSVAKLFVEKIYYRGDQLRHFPLSGRKVPEVDDPNIRELIYKNYRIVYHSPKKDLIRILTVFHSSKTSMIHSYQNDWLSPVLLEINVIPCSDTRSPSFASCRTAIRHL